MPNLPKLQWECCFTIWHAPDFGHKLELRTYTKGRDAARKTELGSWTGLGVPEQLVQDATTLVNAAIVEHLVTRYGIRGELPMKWGGEPEPF